MPGGPLGGADCSLSHIDLITEDTSIEALSLAGLKLSAVLQRVCACVTWFAQGEQTGRIAGHGTCLAGTSLVCVLSTMGLG